MNLALHQNTLEMIQRYADDNHCLELLRFFGKYSNARFNRLAIIHGLYNGSALSLAHGVEKALKRVVDDKLINTSLENGIALYSLTGDKSSREMAAELAAIGSPRLRVLLKENRIPVKKQPSPEVTIPCKPVIFHGSFMLRPAGMGLS